MPPSKKPEAFATSKWHPVLRQTANLHVPLLVRAGTVEPTSLQNPERSDGPP